MKPANLNFEEKNFQIPYNKETEYRTGETDTNIGETEQWANFGKEVWIWWRNYQPRESQIEMEKLNNKLVFLGVKLK